MHQRSSLTPLCKEIRSCWCTIEMFRRTQMNISIMAGIMIHQTGRNRRLVCLIILPGTIGVSIFVMINKCSSRMNHWRFAMSPGAKGNWSKRWNQWGGLHELKLRCSSVEKNSSSVLFREEANYKEQLLSILPWMHKQGKLPNPASCKYFAWLILADRPWYVDRHDYWCQDCHFELRRWTIRQQTHIFVG